MDTITLKKKEHHRYRVWFNQAWFDLKAAEISFEKGFYEWASYQSVQSVEKALKAVLVHAGWRPPMTHKLGVLVSMANHANKLFFDVKMNFRKIEAYTLISRYPFIFPDRNMPPHLMINKQDARTCIDIATEIYYQIETFLKLNKVVSDKDIVLDDFYFTEEEIDKRLKEIVNEIKISTEIKVEKIILFGSFAKEKTRPISSTMDILVIGETNLDFIQRIKLIRELTKGKEPIIEPIVYTKEELAFMVDEEGEGFLESALEQGKVIFDSRALETSSVIVGNK